MKNTKEALVALFALYGVFEAARADGKIGIEDLGLLFPAIPTLGPALQDAGLIQDEYKNASAAERAEVIAFVKEKFDIADDALEAKIELGISLLVLAGEFFKKA